jgi:hypothetical protein
MKKTLSISINKLAKLIDENKPCISCGSYEPLEAGHYKSVGAFANMQWYIHNIHGQCHYCNQHLSGNSKAYRIGLERRYGTDYVEMIESFNANNKVLKLNRYDIAEMTKTIKLWTTIIEQDGRFKDLSSTDERHKNLRIIIDNHFKNEGYYK